MRDVTVTGDADEHVARILALTHGKKAARYSIRRQLWRYSDSHNSFLPGVATEARNFARSLPSDSPSGSS
jgi:hypothetical protein